MYPSSPVVLQVGNDEMATADGMFLPFLLPRRGASRETCRLLLWFLPKAHFSLQAGS